MVENKFRNCGDDAEDMDHCDLIGNIVVVRYSLRFPVSDHMLPCLLYFRFTLFAINIS